MKKTEVATPAPAFRVLLVDDNRNGLLARKSVLEEYGFSVMAFSLPEEAVQAFQDSAFDLVITDYRMPKLNGTDVIRIVREMKPDTPIILISGVVDALGLNEKNTGADSVIPKSSTEVSHLVRAVNRLLRPGTPKKPASSQTAKPRVKRAMH
jgi:CheY-like chemotaxis protein